MTVVSKDQNIHLKNKKISHHNLTSPIEKYKGPTHWYFSILYRFPLLIIIGFSFLLLGSMFTILPSILIGEAIDILGEQGFSNAFLFKAALIVIASVLAFVLSFGASYSWALAAFRFERDIRQEFFDIIQSKHTMAFHDQIDSSKLLSMGMNEINQVRVGMMPSLRMIISTTIAMIIIAIKLMTTEFSLGLIVLIGFPIFIWISYRYAKRIEIVRRKLAKQIGVITTSSQEIFRGIDVVRSFGGTEREYKRFENESQTYANLVTKEGRLAAWYLPGLIIIVLTAITFAIGLFNITGFFNVSDFINSFGIITVPSTKLTIGKLITSLSLLFTLQMFSFMLPNSLLQMQAGAVNAKRIWDIMTWEDPKLTKKIEQESIDKLINCLGCGDIVFENVSFRYGKSKYALQKINITIKNGSKVALIGGPGSGKSTMLKLLLRLYDPTEGAIKIGGIDIKKIPAREIRKVTKMVEQEIFLFSDTIKENIKFSNREATDEDVIEAAKKAQAHDFIMKLPNGYDTMIGERGAQLSGGQRQRLALARAILANPKILLLDDSASAIDAKTEYEIRKALDTIKSGRTTIEVTQRLVTLLKADLIILLDKGRIIATGTHKELIETSPEYKIIFDLLPKSEGGRF